MKFIVSAIASFLFLQPNASSVFGFHAPTAFIASPSSSKSNTADLQKSTTKLSATCGGKLNCRAIGIGSAAPKTVVTNSDLENIVETDDEWIRTRTGISERRLLLHSDETLEEGEEPETIKSLAIDAAMGALEMSGVDPLDIDLVIVATSSPDDLFGDATSVAASVGATNAVAFDLTAACSGFLFSTVTAGQFLDKGTMKNALVVGADALSRWIDWDDRNSCILFGDGAGAMVLSTTVSEEGGDDAEAALPGILGYSAHSNGKGYGDLNCGYKGSARPVDTPGEQTVLSAGSYNKLAMNGKKVYAFATREVPTVITEALDAAGMTVDDVDWLLLHQVCVLF